MVMKRYVLILFAATIAFSSCSLFKEKDYTEEEKRIETAKNDALAAVDAAKTAAIQAAEEAISSATAKAVEGASADIAVAINEAKKDIQAAVETSVNEKVDDKLKKFDDDLASANSIARIAIIIGLAAVVLAIVFFILLMRRTSRDDIIETVQDSERIKKMVSRVVDSKIAMDVKPYLGQGGSKVNVEAEVKRYLGNPQTLRYLAGLISGQVRVNQDVTDPHQTTVTKPVETPVTRQSEPQPIPKVELFAKDSPNNILAGVTTSYMQGKSIYRLLLNSQEASTAEITICTDREEVKRRILKSSNDLLEPVCVVDRKRSNPEDLSTINIKAGKAEKLSADSWKVTEPIIVELS